MEKVIQGMEHSTEIMFQCRLCTKEFKNEEELTSHSFMKMCEKSDSKQKRNSIKKEYKFKCEKCDQLFNDKSAMKRHIKVIHDKVRDKKCDICGKAFTLPHHLRGHVMTVHKNLKNYHCKLCQKSFGDPATLARHSHILEILMKRKGLINVSFVIRHSIILLTEQTTQNMFIKTMPQNANVNTVTNHLL